MLEKALDYAAREAACGMSTRASFAKFDPVSFSWRIPLFLFAGELSQYSGKWPRWGMMVAGECYPLPTWEDAINATVFGGRSGDAIEYLTPCENGLEGGANGMTPEERREEYHVRVTMKTRKRLQQQDGGQWPTVTAKGNGNREEYGGRSRDELGTAVARAESAQWPTVTSRDWRGTNGQPHGRGDANLNDEVVRRAKSATGPTPCARDHHAGGPGNLDRANGHMVSLATLVEKSRAESATGPTPTCAGLDGGSHSRKAAKARGRYIANGAAAESATGPTPTAHAAKHTTETEKPRDALNYAVERGETKSHTYPTIGTKTMGGCSGSQHKLEELERIGALRADERRVLQSGNGGVTSCGYLNPDWVEWLMNWPLGWTNPDATALIWLTPEDDPADLDTNADGYIPRITTTKTNRVKRIETLGNGQFPLTAAAAFIFGRAILAACHK